MPLLGETGCRLAEIVGLRLEDIDLENELIHIRPNSARRLKNKNSERVCRWLVMQELQWYKLCHRLMMSGYFPSISRSGHCYATHASNAVNKWLKNGLWWTNGTLPETYLQRPPDELLSAPRDMIDQIGGWRSS